MVVQTRNRIVDKEVLRLFPFSRPSVYIKQGKKETPDKYLLLASRDFDRDVLVSLCIVLFCRFILFYKELYILDTLRDVRIKMEAEIEFRLIRR